MAKLIIGKGLDEYISKLGNLEFKSPEAMGKAIYDGAKVVADATMEALKALPTESGQTKSVSGRHVLRGLTTYEKSGLIDGFGVSKQMDDGGFINVKLGVEGYNGHATKKYPNGAPNLAVARAMEAGTSFMKKNPVFSRVARSKKAEAERVMQETLDKEIKQIMND